MESNHFNSLVDVLAAYDVAGKRFAYHDYMGALCSLPEGERAKHESRHEWTAFMLQPNDSDHTFGGYFGPQLTMADANGNPVYTPALADITPEAVLYWEQRYKTATNALMRMRYAALVWDFKKRIANDNYDADLYRTYVDSMLDVVNNDLEAYPVVTTNVLERLFGIAKSQPADLNKTKDALRSFESHHANDKSARCWACQFQLVLDNKKCFTQAEIDALVQQHEARLATPDVKLKTDDWNRYYNYLRPHESLGDMTPMKYSKRSRDDGPDVVDGLCKGGPCPPLSQGYTSVLRTALTERLPEPLLRITGQQRPKKQRIFALNDEN